MPTQAAVRFQFKVFSLSDFTDGVLINNVFNIFDSLPVHLRPKRHGPYEPANREYTRDNREAMVSAWLNEECSKANQPSRSGCLLLESGPPARASYLVDWDWEIAPRFNMISGEATVRGDVLSGGLRDFVGMTQDFAVATDAAFALVDLDFPQTSNRMTRINLEVRLPDPCWMMFFGAPYVRLFGAERFRSAPCHEVVELPSGHFRLMLTPSPGEPVPEETKQRIREHFGLTAFVEPGKPIRTQKVGLVPSFDFSQVYSSRE